MRFLVPLICVVLAFPAAAQLYVRGALGFEQSRDTTLRDRDCTATQPPALFGCGSGSDARPLGARGGFGGTPAIELGLGYGSRARVELALTHRTEIDLDAEANFLGVSGRQPVRATGRSTAALVHGAIELARASWRIRPFVTAGAGMARNETDAITYAFPGIDPRAVTITPGGSHTNFAWSAGAGASIALSPSLALDIAFRTTDLGDLRAEDGEATIVRPRGTFPLAIAGTRAEVKTRGIVVAVRYRVR